MSEKSTEENEDFSRGQTLRPRLRRGIVPLARARRDVMVGVGCMLSVVRRRRTRIANHDVAAGPSLDSLPVDVLLEVTKHLKGNDLLSFAAVSRGWRDALEPAFESKCVSGGHENRAWRFLEIRSIETRSTPRGNCRESFRVYAQRYLTWKDRFCDEFCAWCREAPNARVNLVATFQQETRGWHWSRLASRGMIAHSAETLCPVPSVVARRSVKVCGKCLARDEAKALTRTFGMELGAPLEVPDRAFEGLKRESREEERPSFLSRTEAPRESDTGDRRCRRPTD